jgi:hypothetical protein
MELHADFRGIPLCRVVSYRELLHIQIGQNPMWETRVRASSEFPPVMEHIVRAFLRAFAATSDEVQPRRTTEAGPTA